MNNRIKALIISVVAAGISVTACFDGGCLPPEAWFTQLKIVDDHIKVEWESEVTMRDSVPIRRYRSDGVNWPGLLEWERSFPQYYDINEGVMRGGFDDGYNLKEGYWYSYDLYLPPEEGGGALRHVFYSKPHTVPELNN